MRHNFYLGFKTPIKENTGLICINVKVQWGEMGAEERDGTAMNSEERKEEGDGSQLNGITGKSALLDSASTCPSRRLSSSSTLLFIVSVSFPVTHLCNFSHVYI